MRAHRTLTALTTLAGLVGVAAAPAAATGGPVGGTGSTFHLTNSFAAHADTVVTVGEPDDEIFVGDWDGDGTDTFAYRRGATFTVTDARGEPVRSFAYGRGGDRVLVGDWDGDGDDTFAVRRGAVYHVKNTIAPGSADTVVRYGRAGDQVLVGDWDGSGADAFAVRRGATYQIADTIRGGPADRVVTYGRSDDTTVVGDWDGDGTDTLGVRRPGPAPAPPPEEDPAPPPEEDDPAPAPPEDAVTERPTAANTGVPAGTTLQESTGRVISTDGTVIDGEDIRGTLYIEATDVTVRNTRVSGTGRVGIHVRNGGRATIVDTEVTGFQNGIRGSHWTAQRVDIYGVTQDGVKLGTGSTLLDSWIHDLTPEAGAHADGGQVESGVKNVLVRNNVIDAYNADSGRLGNAALIIKPDLGSDGDGPVVIDDNYLNGGNYTLYVRRGDSGNTIEDISVTDNRFGPDRRYGRWSIDVPVTLSGNVDVEPGD